MAISGSRQAPNISAGLHLGANPTPPRAPITIQKAGTPVAPPFGSTRTAAPSWGPSPTDGLGYAPMLPVMPLPPPATSIPQQSLLVGTDTVMFTVKPFQTVTVTFPNLPTRVPTANPLGLRGAATAVKVRSYDTLHFGLSLQNVSGTLPKISPLTVDASRARAPGSFLGGGNSYGTFQAVITAGAQGASGEVVGTLTYQVAS